VLIVVDAVQYTMVAHTYAPGIVGAALKSGTATGPRLVAKGLHSVKNTLAHSRMQRRDLL